MEKQQRPRSLVLHKETILELTDSELRQVAGALREPCINDTECKHNYGTTNGDECQIRSLAPACPLSSAC